jgi:hypothetical protein
MPAQRDGGRATHARQVRQVASYGPSKGWAFCAAQARRSSLHREARRGSVFPMTSPDWYGLAALTALLLIFYYVRAVPAYVALGAAVALGFGAATFGLLDWSSASEWIVMTVGLLACAFGLLIVRVMLIRSVSLHLLRGMEGAGPDSFGEDIGARLNDMRAFGLIQTSDGVDGRTALTSFGWMVSGVVSALYFTFRIKA